MCPFSSIPGFGFWVASTFSNNTCASAAAAMSPVRGSESKGSVPLFLVTVSGMTQTLFLNIRVIPRHLISVSGNFLLKCEEISTRSCLTPNLLRRRPPWRQGVPWPAQGLDLERHPVERRDESRLDESADKSAHSTFSFRTPRFTAAVAISAGSGCAGSGPSNPLLPACLIVPMSRGSLPWRVAPVPGRSPRRPATH